jgi:hypothetical protein
MDWGRNEHLRVRFPYPMPGGVGVQQGTEEPSFFEKKEAKKLLFFGLGRHANLAS